MSDPRNVAHDKKVKQEKEHHHEQSPKSAAAAPEVVKVEQAPGDAEKSAAVLSKLKEMEFHSRANIETLAGLTLTIEDELKQKEFSEPIGALYSAQDGFQTQIAALIQSYEAKSESLKPSSSI
jgi:hypothetical protein